MPMKVTVCFDRVRVIVPCGDGDLLVKELTEKAILRYKKATGKSNDHWVSVHNLRTINDGGILDPDDQLNDVVDDREQLIADYEEQGGQTYQPHNGDGASQSSAGTASPDIFQGSGESSSPFPSTKTISVYQPSNENDVVVTSKDIETHGSLLTVRHGSEPALNILDGDKPYKKDIKAVEEPSDSEDLEVEKEMAPSGDKGKAPISRFSRDTWRQSLGNRPDMYKWLEAQERQQERMEGPIHPMERREPVGGVSTEPGTDSRVDHHTHSGILIHLPNDGGPLGIHVLPDYDDSGKELGLLVQGVEEGGRVFKDGRLRENDRIIEINGQTLMGVTFSKAQDIFRSAMKDNNIRLRIIKKQGDDSVSETLPVLQPPEKTGDTDGLLTANLNKEILRLDIPLSESGSAGLGVSVKGKTMTTDRGTRDLGIFVKSVIHGGAASKDGRLAVNDQLIEVNSEKLMGLSNTDDMEMLRRAMQLDGPIPGHIHLVVTRKIGAPSPSPFTQEASPDAFVFGANNRMVRKTDHAKHSLMKDADMVESPRLDYMDGSSGKARNFLIDRVTNGGLQNESYTKATQDELDDSAMSHDQDEGFRNQSYNLALRGSGNILSPGTSPFKPMQKSTPFVDPNVMIENDDEEMNPPPYEAPSELPPSYEDSLKHSVAINIPGYQVMESRPGMIRGHHLVNVNPATPQHSRPNQSRGSQLSMPPNYEHATSSRS